MNLPIYKIFLKDSDILGVALVDEPAIDEEFLKFNKDELKINFNSDLQVISGLVMIPDQLIYRNDSLGERYVFYDKDTVERAATLFLKNGMKFNLSHSGKLVQLDVVESYLTKANNEFNAPIGSWVLTARVNDLELWERIKNGEFNGFSFQSLFINELFENFNKQEKMKKEEFKSKFLELFDNLLFNKESMTPEVTKVVETAQEVNVNFNSEEFLSSVTNLLSTFKSDMLSEIDGKLLGFKEELSTLNEKVETFSNQPITQSITTEQAANVELDKLPKAAKFFIN
jgi:hypothetical protein